jgi:hypothetical protein
VPRIAFGSLTLVAALALPAGSKAASATLLQPRTLQVNPSTRPIVAKQTGVQAAGDPSPPQSQTGGVAGSSTTEDDPDDGAVAAVPSDANSNDSLNFNDHPITVPATGDNASMRVRVSWPSSTGDWDVKLYEDVNGDGRSQNDEPVVGTSQTRPSNVEEVSVSGTPRLTAGKKYVLRVNNFAASAADNYDVDITFEAPPPFEPPSSGATTPATPGGAAPLTFGARTRVALELVARRIPAQGPFKVRVRNANGFGIAGRLSGQTPKPVTVTRKRRIKLKARSFRVAANARRTVTLRLPRALQRLLKRRGRLALRLTASVTDPAGSKRNLRKNVTLRLTQPRRRR